MKKLLSLFGAVALMSLVAVNAAPFQNNDKSKKEQPSKGNSSGKKEPGQQSPASENPGKNKNDNKDRAKDQDPKDRSGKGNDDNDKSKNKDRDKNGLEESNNENGKENRPDKKDVDFSNGWRWDRDKFKNRRDFRSSDKVTICHKFRSADEPAVNLTVSENALKAHLGHGDVMGECPVEVDRRLTEDELRRRAEYYNTLEKNREQIIYSRSILDYARERLAEARQQIVVLRSNNVPVADIERKEIVIVELDRNVSALERALGTAAAIAVDKLL